MQIIDEALNGLVVVKPKVFEDNRGFFAETYREDLFKQLNLPTQFVQDNHSSSGQGVLRGLHFQWEPPMGKIMRVTAGVAFLAAVDVRKGSPSLGKWYGLTVTAANKLQIWAPAGFARGFCVLSDFAEIQYKCTGLYNSSNESGIRWNDSEVGIEWPIDNPILSQKDSKAQTLSEWLLTPESNNFKF